MTWSSVLTLLRRCDTFASDSQEGLAVGPHNKPGQKDSSIMFDHITKDVQLAMFASMVRGIVLHYSNHLRLLVTYGAIAESVKTLPRGGQLAQALALITEDDHKAKRPLTTAVVVNAEHEIPGVGFFEQCRTLGYTIDTTPDAECLFWKNQLDRMRVAPFTLEGALRTRTGSSRVRRYPSARAPGRCVFRDGLNHVTRDGVA